MKNEKEFLEEIEAALAKRLKDWRESTSEWYAMESGEEQWRSGLVNYLMYGPGAVTEVVKRHD